jgi:N-acetylglucosaminyl-diphospho-decaprenol L-rhamnosyltransferase
MTATSSASPWTASAAGAPARSGVPTAAAPDVQVVVVTYSPGACLAAFLDSLRQATRRSYEVVLADNGSTDGAVEAAARRPEVTVRRTGGNIGYGRAANVGAQASTAEWLVVANPDIIWRPGSLDMLLDAAARYPDAAALGPAIVTPDRRLYPSARALPSLGRGTGHALCGWWWPGNPWTAVYRNERGQPAETAAGWLSGSCLLLRRGAFEQVRGFDPAYFMYFEDVDLCDRLSRAGWRNIYVPAAVVEHAGGHATARMPAEMLRAHHRSAYRYLAARHPGWRWLPVRLALAVGLALRYLLSVGLNRAAEGAQPTRSADVLAPW